jgi:Ser/Thr protein kinase RdoA (MazF antagonist)
MLMEWADGENATAAAGGRAVGRAVARLHRSLRGLEGSFPDRPLKLDCYGGYRDQFRSLGVDAGSMRAMVERHQVALTTWDRFYEAHLPRQLLHGDLHEGNVILDDTGACLIDFDKMMVGPRIFDLAKFIATSCFLANTEARLARRKVEGLMAGYQEVDRLTDAERASIGPLCMIVNAENALYGFASERREVIHRAEAVGRWWARRSGRGKLHSLSRRRPSVAHQLALFGTRQGELEVAQSAR